MSEVSCDSIPDPLARAILEEKAVESMIRGFTILLLCQLLGEIVSRALGLPVPGPVLGLVLLVVGLHLRAKRYGLPDAEGTEVARVADSLLRNLGLLFVPAGVGVVQYAGLLKSEALAQGCALVGSTVVTLVATVFVFVGVSRWRDRRRTGDAA